MSDDPYFATVNAMRKVVVSNTLKTATWNAEVLRGDAAEQIRILKQQPGKSIMKYGVTSLDRTLMAHQLIDEFHFSIYPVIAEGAGIFGGFDTSRMQLKLISTRRYASGVVEVSLTDRGGYEANACSESSQTGIGLPLKLDGVMKGGNEIGARLAFETPAALRRRPGYLIGRIMSETGALVRRILDGIKSTEKK